MHTFRQEVLHHSAAYDSFCFNRNIENSPPSLEATNSNQDDPAIHEKCVHDARVVVFSDEGRGRDPLNEEQLTGFLRTHRLVEEAAHHPLRPARIHALPLAVCGGVCAAAQGAVVPDEEGRPRRGGHGAEQQRQVKRNDHLERGGRRGVTRSPRSRRPREKWGKSYCLILYIYTLSPTSLYTLSPWHQLP